MRKQTVFAASSAGAGIVLAVPWSACSTDRLPPLRTQRLDLFEALHALREEQERPQGIATDVRWSSS